MHEDNLKDPAQALQQPVVTKPANHLPRVPRTADDYCSTIVFFFFLIPFLFASRLAIRLWETALYFGSFSTFSLSTPFYVELESLT